MASAISRRKMRAAGSLIAVVAVSLLLTAAGHLPPDPWSATGDMAGDRSAHTATLLPDGKVLVAGGWSTSTDDPILSSAEIYDSEKETWSDTGSMLTARYSHQATLLSNGLVLVTGGTDSGYLRLSSAELFDPADGTWSSTGDMNVARYLHTATLLPDGSVLAAGGFSYDEPGILAEISAERYNPITGEWTLTDDMAFPRETHTATLLQDGKVLVAGGHRGYDALSTSELYDPAEGSWSTVSSLNQARFGATANLLPDGRVLLTGGGGPSTTSTPSHRPSCMTRPTKRGR